jgi:uncharacterized protein YjiS (DUF1127 family)
VSSVCSEGRLRRRQPLYVVMLSITRSIFGLVLLWRERSRTRRLLAAMSERELQDIGVCRSDVSDEIGRPFWR